MYVYVYIQYAGSDDVQLLLVGNKYDLSAKRVVSSSEAEKVSKRDTQNVHIAMYVVLLHFVCT